MGLSVFLYFLFRFTPGLQNKTGKSPMPSSLLSNMLTKLPLQSLVHSNNPSTNLVTCNLESGKFKSQVFGQQARTTGLEKQSQNLTVNLIQAGNSLNNWLVNREKTAKPSNPGRLRSFTAFPRLPMSETVHIARLTLKALLCLKISPKPQNRQK